MSTLSAYDALAPHYREYASKRSAYHQGIDGFILPRFPKAPRRMLDLGAGDGVRGVTLARQVGVEQLILCDASAEMVAHCRALNAGEVWHSSATDLPTNVAPFDVITCLWNVMGHLDGRAARIAALGEMHRLLAPGGRIFLDVNNRHNAAAYGRRKVLGRRIWDALWFDEANGDVKFDWDIAGKKFPASGHLFVPAEMRRIIRAAGLTVLESVAVDYATGQVSTRLTEGQLLFVLGRGAESNAAPVRQATAFRKEAA